MAEKKTYQTWHRPQKPEYPECVLEISDRVRGRLYGIRSLYLQPDVAMEIIDDALREAYGYGFEDA